MKLQKVGGFGSIGSAFIIAIFLVIVGLVFPRLGLVGPSDRMDPIKGIAAESASRITFFLLNLVLILCGIAFVLIILALRERMQANAPNVMRLALIGVSIAFALWLASGLIGIVGMRPIVSAKDASAYRALMGVWFGLVLAGDHAVGWALLLIGWAALKIRALPRILSYLSVLVGIVFILDFAAKPLMPVSLFLCILWNVWLGVVLLRNKS
jgi:hypothetical protein